MHEKLTKPDLLIDGDILAYKASSATDGRQYRITYMVEGTPIYQYQKYKKRADQVVAELQTNGHPETTCEVTYTPEAFEECVKVMESAILSLETKLSVHTVGGFGDKLYYLTRHGSFRETKCPTYKKNRVGVRRPYHLEAAKDWLIDQHGAITKPGEYEADDMMAMRQHDNSIICSIDKDLLQVPGNHFNWDKNKYTVVTEEDGWRSLFIQALTGDTADGIPGLKGVGPVTATALLKDVTTPFMMYCVVLKAYIQKAPLINGEITRVQPEFTSRIVAQLDMQLHMLYLLRHEKDEWVVPERPEGL